MTARQRVAPQQSSIARRGIEGCFQNGRNRFSGALVCEFDGVSVVVEQRSEKMRFQSEKPYVDG